MNIIFKNCGTCIMGHNSKKEKRCSHTKDSCRCQEYKALPVSLDKRLDKKNIKIMRPDGIYDLKETKITTKFTKKEKNGNNSRTTS